VRAGVYESGEMYLASIYFGKNAINHTGMKLSVGDTFVETPSIPYDGGLNFHFTDLGNVTEVVTYMGEKCEAAADFIYNNQTHVYVLPTQEANLVFFIWATVISKRLLTHTNWLLY